MGKKSVVAKYAKMTGEQLAAASAEFEREMAVLRTQPLTPEERRWWNQARRRPGRPRRGKGVKVVSVSVEQGLLARSDLVAKRLGISRARLIERGIKAVLAAEGRL